MSDSAAALLQDLHSSREQLLSVVAGVTEEQFKRRPPKETVPEAGDWSISEVLAHLLACEQREGSRLEALLRGEPAPGTPLTEEGRNAEARQGRLVPVPQIIHGLLAARRRIAMMLAGVDAIPDAAVSLLRDDVIAHETAHRAQIEAVKGVLTAARPAR